MMKNAPTQNKIITRAAQNGSFLVTKRITANCKTHSNLVKKVHNTE